MDNSRHNLSDKISLGSNKESFILELCKKDEFTAEEEEITKDKL